jgi:hypothetical protein
MENIAPSTNISQCISPPQGTGQLGILTNFPFAVLVMQNAFKSRIFKLLWSPRIDSKEPIPPAYVAWLAGTITLFLLGF